MATRKQQIINTHYAVVVFVSLIIGIPLYVFTVGQQTVIYNQASGPQQTLSGQAITNLNSTTDTLSTINADGTMGPQTAYGNWSNSLPSFLQGKLVFQVTDPVQGGKPIDTGSQGQRPTDSFHAEPSHAMPTQAQENNNGENSSVNPGQTDQGNGPQTVSSLDVTITKVEVHMAYQGTPGDITGDQGQGGKPSVSPTQQGQSVDHWETLTLVTPVTVDLVKLAASHDLSSLGLTTLAAGRYTEVRLYVSNASATLTDGTSITLAIPGKNNIVRVVQPFTITAGQTTNVTMDFDAQHSVIKAGDQYLLKPVVARLIEQHQ